MKLIKVFAAILLTAPLTLVAQIDRTQSPEPGPALIVRLKWQGNN